MFPNGEQHDSPPRIGGLHKAFLTDIPGDSRRADMLLPFREEANSPDVPHMSNAGMRRRNGESAISEIDPPI